MRLRPCRVPLALWFLLGCAPPPTAGPRPAAAPARPITSAGQPARLDIRQAGAHSLRITLAPLTHADRLPANPVLAEREFPEPALSLREIGGPVEAHVGALRVAVRPAPLTVEVRDASGRLIQEVAFADDGTLTFRLDDAPVLGMGEGGPRPPQGANWRDLPVEFDRRGRMHEMVPRWQSNAYGSRNPVAMLVGTGGWGLLVAAPWGAVDLRDARRGVFAPRSPSDVDSLPQTRRNQGENRGKGIPPRASMVPGLYDVFVFDARVPAHLMKDVAEIIGAAVMPPRWALGYMQSHRTLRDETQMIDIVDTFREKRIPLDAVIYLGTGFTPRGWNTEQPSFDFNPEVFRRSGREVIADLHARNVKVVVHMVPPDRDELPTLHGSIPPVPGEPRDAAHIATYWARHVPLVEAGVDAFWPDEGDWFDLFERIKRHQLYYEGPLSTRPDVRPWSLHRNGHLGIARWGGWVWSGDTDAAWKTLEAQVAVGINHSLSLSPHWGSDIGGFYPNPEKTGELYARWFQFGAFTPSFRAHARTWQLALPWGWGLPDMGVRENDNRNGNADDARRNPLQSEMNNPAIEPVARRYAELRYQLLPYIYTLAREARDTGMPLMRAMWLHYPDDETARGIGSQYLWGRDLLIAPVFEKGATRRDVYLPAGEWTDWWSGERHRGPTTLTRAVDLATMPIYVRAGAIIPFDPIRQHTGEVVDAPTTLRVYTGADGDFTLYEDDGVSLGYLRGEGRWTRVRWDDGARRLRVEAGARAGAGGAVPRVFRVELLQEGRTATVEYAGEPVEIRF